MKATLASVILLITALTGACLVDAHEVRPGYLELKQADETTYDLLWKIPAKGDRRLGIYVRLPDNCERSETRANFLDNTYIERQKVTCSGGLSGGTIAIDGLDDTRTDVLAHVVFAGGQTQTARLTPAQASFAVMKAQGPLAVAETYFRLGVEHILLGFDHLLFVLALLFLVDGWRRLVFTITAFTIAHSLTLAAATFDWVRVPQAPVEAVIALSIMFVAVEILSRHQGKTGMATRRPWAVAFGFGLLHGLGFAGALKEIGLPDQAVPLALAFFNAGVEAGQLCFVGGVCLMFKLMEYVAGRKREGLDPSHRRLKTLTPVLSYAIGTIAAFWFIERTVGLFA